MLADRRSESATAKRHRVHFGHSQLGGHPYGWLDGYKVIPSHHTFDVKPGETWLVEEVTRFEASDAGAGTAWGNVIYCWPVKRIK